MTVANNTDDRRPEELNTIRDCVEEIFLAVQRAHVIGFVSTPLERGRNGLALYDRVEAIVLRAQELPRPSGDPGSSPRNG